MNSLPQSSVKYIIKASIDSKGVVEKPDIIGAIFGQTEGLLGPEMDLRELQVHGKVGRIDVSLECENGCSHAMIEMPSSLDSAETAILAASLETIDRVGPCTADVDVVSVDDVRVSKRNYIVRRAQEILDNMVREAPRPEDLSKTVKQHLSPRLKCFGDTYLGPEAEDSDDVVLCEGRSDILNLMDYGVKNTVATGGTSVSDDVADAVGGKTVTVFLDGDRGGDLIMKELEQKIDFDYVARAPKGKEVEDLTKQEVDETLENRRPVDEEPESEKEPEITEEQRRVFSSVIKDLVATRAALLMDENLQTLAKVPVSRMGKALSENEGVYAMVFDGTVDSEIVSKARRYGIKHIVGMSRNASSSEVVCLGREDI